VALAERGGARALLVVLNAPNRWEDVPAMLDHAFLTNKLALQGR
jgi:hypothetical protein